MSRACCCFGSTPRSWWITTTFGVSLGVLSKRYLSARSAEQPLDITFPDGKRRSRCTRLQQGALPA